ncbi:30S ribosomal protein S9 [Candidatus Peregrinibacteria bacterium CG11_big_fil_rev_8_21_14_0_20_41_10]|nr:MAG: 30S ribosomal protein S9 [Candidatus Peregrinibacteria bacterium CG11_big_fil_rev_8_21_14_0_20_41_10]PIZ75715.1 MAG: 30S ribosomal protein S9 [Candidatus Peregrinibacteria bacterium CG_4_10_14_0_2_um_filter_41_8]PJC37995.1 MAG: 30S ribosomal protein S9 [Candidatus Peregrinibacteria bacterium CG_4_9_14_0_2_um_filter_41_14]
MNLSGKYHYANGKRKAAVSRVRIYEDGKGEIYINNQTAEEFTNTKEELEKLTAPLKMTGNTGKYTITIKISGGGYMSQAESARHGIAKALQEMDPTLRTTLKKAGFITRDSRVKERKKFGLKKARRSPQFSKR